MVPVLHPDGKIPRRRVYRRRAIFLLDVVSVTVYMEMLARGRVSAQFQCPDKCSGTFSRHSTFTREWVDYDCVAYTLIIVRVRCSECRGVWSLFPAFVWYRFRFSYRLVQSACWGMLSGKSSTEISDELAASLSPVVKERGQFRVPAESTIRTWVQWLGQRCLEPLIRRTLSLIARRSAQAARTALPLNEVRPALPGANLVHNRAERVLRICAALDGATKGRSNLARRSPHQLRDWACALFRERRQPLARPP